jgi:hypothetical protein
VKRWLALASGLAAAGAALWALATWRAAPARDEIGAPSRVRLERVLEHADREAPRR